MTRNAKSSLGTVFLWVSLGLTAAAQSLSPVTQLSGAYDCSAPGFAKQKIILLPGGRWVEGALFNPAAFKTLWISEKTRSNGSRMMFPRREPALPGTFRVEKDRIVLFYPGGTYLGMRSFLNEFIRDPLEFRIDPASSNLIQIGWGTFRQRLTCTRDGLF